jgi:C4-dicarboxylate-specific signal transduction histidine kinase
MMCLPLVEWVIENLCKNAIDAMDGQGSIDIYLKIDAQKCYIDVKDTGKGISRKHFKTVFNPGYTTKKRWQMLSRIQLLNIPTSMQLK